MGKKNHANIMFINSTVQVIGIALIFNKITTGMCIITASVLFQFFYAVKGLHNNKSSKIRKKCNSNIPEPARTSQIYGVTEEAGNPEKELAGFMAPEPTGRHFEEIEELAVEEMANFDGGIEAFLKRKLELDI